jgi:hypothetical protein
MKNLLALGMMLCVTASATEIPERFFKALNYVETSGRSGAIKGDNGQALGPFQIHKAYWQDARTFDRYITGTYYDCANYSYAKTVVNAYLHCYGERFIQTGDLEALARIHNGGARGFQNRHTEGYWKKVNRELRRKNH